MKAAAAVSLTLLLLAGLAGAVWGAAYGVNQLSRFGGAVASPMDLPHGGSAVAATGPLRVHPTNPRYFTDGSGRAVLLAGAHTWYTLQDSGWTDPPRVFDYTAFLDSLVANQNNFIRMFVWEQARWSVPITADYYFAPQPYQRTGPGTALDGKPKFDLTKFNQAYFDRLRQRVQQAGQRGIYVAIQLFDGFSVEAKPWRAAHNPWPGHPFNGSNNINGINGDADRDGQGKEIQTLQIPAVTALQEAYVRKVIDSVNDLDNVLYEICNEANGNSETWQYHLVQLIKSYEAGKPKQHPVGMTVEWPNGDNAELFASDADWIEPNSTGGYWDNPPAADGRKVIVNDTDHLCYPCGDTAWVWRTVARGMNPAFMDAYDCNNDVESSCNPNEPDWVNLRRNLGYARRLTGQMNLAAMTPHADLCSTKYCLASTADAAPEYLVYLPSGRTTAAMWSHLGIHSRRLAVYSPPDSRVVVDLSAAQGELKVDWLEPATGLLTRGETVVGGDRRTLVAPFSGDAVLHIYAEPT